MDAPLVTSVLVAKPEHFGKDGLSNFLEMAQKNTYANFVSKTAEYQKLLDLDCAFRKIVENISQQDDAVYGLLMMRCHSSFLNAIRVLMSCAVVETHILLRSVLEAALYALHIDNDSSLFAVWIKRHDSSSALERCRSQFGYGRVIATLRTKNQSLAERVSYLYDTTIDFGAHPNEMAVTSHLNLDKTDKQVTIKANYLTGEAVALTHAFKVTLQVGIEALSIFEIMRQKRFELLGITEVLEKTKVGL